MEDLSILLFAAGVEKDWLAQPAWTYLSQHPDLVRPSVIDSLQSLARRHAEVPETNRRSKSGKVPVKNRASKIAEEYRHELQLLGHSLLQLLNALKRAADARPQVGDCKVHFSDKLSLKTLQHRGDVLLRVGATAKVLSAHLEASNERAGLQQRHRGRSSSAAGRRSGSSSAASRQKQSCGRTVDAPCVATSTKTAAHFPVHFKDRAIAVPETTPGLDATSKTTLKQPAQAQAAQSKSTQPAEKDQDAITATRPADCVVASDAVVASSLVKNDVPLASISTPLVETPLKNCSASPEERGIEEVSDYDMSPDASNAWDAVVTAIALGDEQSTAWALDAVVNALAVEEFEDDGFEDDCIDLGFLSGHVRLVEA